MDPNDLRVPGHVRLYRSDYEKTYEPSEWDEESYIRHDSDHHVLLEIESPGVETPSITESGELFGREDRFQKFASRESEQLSDIG